MDHRVKITRFDVNELMPRLHAFESKYGMSTGEFLNRWISGELDSHDYVRWFGLCQMAIRAGQLAEPQPALLATA